MPSAAKMFSSSSYCNLFLLLRQPSENCGLCYRRFEPLRTGDLGPVTETEVISYQTAAPQPAVPGQATVGPPEDQISDFARVRILNTVKTLYNDAGRMADHIVIPIILLYRESRVGSISRKRRMTRGRVF